MNESFSNMFEGAMERTVTIDGLNGSPSVTLKLLHAVAAALAAVIVAPRATAIAGIAALLKGVTITIDEPEAEPAA